MALTPEEIEDQETEVDLELEESLPEPSRTWFLDFERGRIRGMIDEDAALRQFIIKALSTERNKYVIYSENYGNELKELIGDDLTDALLGSELPRMVEEALIYDERVESVDVSFQKEGDKVIVSAIVTPVRGDVRMREDVILDV